MNLSQLIAVCLLISSINFRSSAADQLLSFEEFFPPQAGYPFALTNGYGGLYWSGLYVYLAPPKSPAHLGLISGKNIAASINTTVELSQSFPFSIKSAWATSTNVTSVTIYVSATRNGTNFSGQTFTVGKTPTLLNLDLTNVTRVSFFQSDYGVVYDDFTITPPPPDQFTPRPDWFKIANRYTPPGPAASVVAGDFNHDGRMDLALIGNSVGSRILLGNSSGGLDRFSDIAEPGEFAAVGDANGDGRDDVVFSVAYGQARYLSVIYDSDHFESLRIFSSSAGFSSNPGPVSAADFDMSAHLAYGQRTKSTDIAVGDFDNDGRLDYALTMVNPPSIALFRNTSRYYGLFEAWGTLKQEGQTPVALVAHDFDGDGDLDLATVNENTGEFGIVRNNGAGVFSNWTLYETGLEHPVALAVRDMDGDGVKDVIVRNRSAGISIIRGMTDGGFGSPEIIVPPTNVTTLPYTRPLVVEDLNGDGSPDIAFVRGSDVVTLTNVVRPPLTISRIADLARVQWQKDFGRGAILESAPTLNGPWQQHSFPPVQESSAMSAYDSTAAASRFFRLRTNR